jgi:hypothetical protein
VDQVIYRERIPARDRRLGRHINHDPRSLLYPFRPRSSRRITSIQHKRYIEVLDQGQLGSCTGNDGIGRLGTGLYYATINAADRYHNLDEPDAVDLYSRATQIDPYPGAYIPGDPASEDTGSDGLSVAKVLKEFGIISGYTWAFSMGDLLQALMERPVGFGTYWFDGMFSPDAEGLVKPTGSVAGGHQFCMDGYDQARGWFWNTNSWGLGFSLGGRFAMEGETVQYLLDRQADMIVYEPSNVEPPTPAPDADHVFADALRPWVARRHTGCNAKTARAAKTWLAAKGL